MEHATPVDFDISQAGALGNGILPLLDAIREQDGIFWSKASNCWMVTRHEDLVRALAGEFPLSLDRLVQVTFPTTPVEEATRRYPTVMRHLPNWVVNLDPPAHTRVRKLLVLAFSRRVVESLRSFVQDRVSTLMATLEAQPEVEFNESFARQLPGSVIIRMLGLPESDLGRLRGWANAFVQAAGVPGAPPESLQAFEEALIDMNGALEVEIEKRRREPRDDVITALVKANEEGDRLSLEEMLGALHILVVAGHDTTASSMSMGLAALAQHPEAWDHLYRHPEETANGVLELARYMAMSTSQPRFVSQDFEWNGKQLRKGQIVFLFFAAGNRDPRVFENPTQLDLTRRNDRALTFAPGVHHCIGHLLAKLQLNIFFEELVKRFEGAELLDPKLAFMPQIVFRGLFELNVRMKPRSRR